MIKRTPQEIADFFQCYVFQGRERNSFYMTPGKTGWNGEDFVLHCDGALSLIDMKLVDISPDHDWAHLYEPQPYSEKSADSDNKEASYLIESSISDNKPDHSSEVYIHKEYVVADGNRIQDLSKKVNTLLSHGWKLQGGVAIEHLPESDGYIEGSAVFYQAMVRGV